MHRVSTKLFNRPPPSSDHKYSSEQLGSLYPPVAILHSYIYRDVRCNCVGILYRSRAADYRPTLPPAPPKPSCNGNPPACYPGAECRDTAEGPRCGRCPQGMVGDGKTCKPGRTCALKPCAPGTSR